MTTETRPPPTAAPSRWRPVRLLLVAAAAVAVLAAIYGIMTSLRNPGDAACGPALATARRIAPLVRGEVAALQVANEGRSLPALTFTDAAGAAKSLADWRGRTVLLNLWATWCVPCRQEMPALQALQQKLGGKDFDVVAVNIDTRDPEKPRKWLREVGIDSLAYYADPSAKVFQQLKAIGRGFGMPTTLLIDPNGCEIGMLAGPAEWGSDDAVALLKGALGS
jgi:thiol-disulfide isomerase/thioredoxin